MDSEIERLAIWNVGDRDPSHKRATLPGKPYRVTTSLGQTPTDAFDTMLRLQRAYPNDIYELRPARPVA